MKCVHCGQEIPPYKENCPNCGAPVVRIRPKAVCSSCGSEVPGDASVCPGCGRKVRRRTEEEKRMAEERVRAESAWDHRGTDSGRGRRLPAGLLPVLFHALWIALLITGWNAYQAVLDPFDDPSAGVLIPAFLLTYAASAGVLWLLRRFLRD